jgi:hypothetical protein
MLWVPPEEVITKRPPCILDVALSLMPAGLFWALGLSRAMPIWLPQCHWGIVDDPAFLADEHLVTHLAGLGDYAAASSLLARVREDWRRARDELALESCPGLFWPADGRRESIVPKDNDGSFVDRFHVLAAGLDARRNGAGSAPNTLADCARDTLALAVALGDRRAIILTPMGQDGSPPALAAHLGSSNVECRALTAQAWIEPLRTALLPALFASGLAVPLAGGRLRLAGLSVTAPGTLAAASIAASMASDLDTLELNAAADQGEAALWDGASAIWWELP